MKTSVIEEATSIYIDMDKLPHRENTNFPLAVTKALEALPDAKFLLRHQLLPIEFFTKYPRARGLLFMHETGSGKSIAAIAIADTYRSLGRRTIVIVPKTLQNNFKDNIVKFKSTFGTDEATARAEISREYSFVSANANNMLSQLKKVSQPTELQEALDSLVEEEKSQDATEQDEPREKIGIEQINLEGAMVIVDEAHHLFNGIVSGSQNARGLYEIIIRTKDIRALFLTGNPMINTPFELVPCFNMIAGYELLPTIYADFMDMFVEKKKTKRIAGERSYASSNGAPKTHSIKNAAMDHFKSRIYGLTSYYGSWFESGGVLNIHSKVSRPNMPTRLPIVEVFVPMAAKQYAAYAAARDKELSRKSYSIAKSSPLSKPSSAGDTSYRIRSRQICNFWLDADAQQNAELAKSAESAKIADPAWIGAAIMDLASHSPKFAVMIKNIEAHSNECGMVYSTFLHTHGLEWFARTLESRGYIKYDATSGEISSDSCPPARRYAFITGDMDIEARSRVLAAFNSAANINGEIIHLLLGSPAMSEGIDTKHIRHVHIMESQWHFAAIEQIIARAVRLHSHDDLPADARVVQPYIYLADYPEDSKLESGAEPTTDVALYYKSIQKKMIADKFFIALIEASIDCNVHIKTASAIAKKNIRCMMCVPDNRPMFNENIVVDMAQPVSCKQSAAREITVEEIELEGRLFYWRREPSGALNIFEYDESTTSYIKLKPSSRWYARILKKLS